MASNFPSSLDTFTNPSSSDAMDSVSVPHASQHSDLNDAVEALQAKVGADSSGVASSHDYKIAALEAVSHGKILQVVSTIKTDTFSASLANSEAQITGLTATITPSNASNKILVSVSCSVAGAFQRPAIRLDRDGTRLALGDTAGSRTSVTSMAYVTTGAELQTIPAIYLDSPASTSALVYSVYILNSSTSTGNYYVNRSTADTDNSSYGRSVSTITVMEVSA